MRVDASRGAAVSSVNLLQQQTVLSTQELASTTLMPAVSQSRCSNQLKLLLELIL
jgi:hypothetical protein